MFLVYSPPIFLSFVGSEVRILHDSISSQKITRNLQKYDREQIHGYVINCLNIQLELNYSSNYILADVVRSLWMQIYQDTIIICFLTPILADAVDNNGPYICCVI